MALGRSNGSGYAAGACCLKQRAVAEVRTKGKRSEPQGVILNSSAASLAAVKVKRLDEPCAHQQMGKREGRKLIEMTKSSGVNMSQRLAAALRGAQTVSQNSWLENELRRTVR